MRHTRLLVIPILAALMFLVGALPGRADVDGPGTFSNPYTIHLPSTLPQLTSWDIEWVDHNTLVVTDRNDKALDIFDTEDARYLRSSVNVDFAGINPTGAVCNMGGPNGVLIAKGDDAWAGGAGPGASSVAVVKLSNGSQVGADIPTGGKCRADELGFAPGEEEVMIGNPSESTNTATPGLFNFETFISTKGTPGPNSVLARLVYDGAGGPCTSVSGTSLGITGETHNVQLCHTPAGANAGESTETPAEPADIASGGLEQPVFVHGYFWLAVPGSSTTIGHLDKIDPDSYQVVDDIDLTGCGSGPTGLVVVSDTEGAAACPNGVTFVNFATESQDGGLVAESGGADEIYYANGNVYAVDSADDASTGGCADPTIVLVPATGSAPITGACLAVVSASSKSVIAEVRLPVGARNVAAGDHKVFVPVKDLECTDTVTPCPPNSTSSPTCPVIAEEGGCIHDQGVAVIIASP